MISKRGAERGLCFESTKKEDQRGNWVPRGRKHFEKVYLGEGGGNAPFSIKDFERKSFQVHYKLVRSECRGGGENAPLGKWGRLNTALKWCKIQEGSKT